MATRDALLPRLEELLEQLDDLPEPGRSQVFEFLDGLDAIHRAAVHALVDSLDEQQLARAAAEQPAVSWLLHAYEASIDQRAEAEAAVEPVRPYIASHGGTLEVLEARDGVVRVRLGGNCSGCTASSATLERGVEEALRRHMPSFVRLEVEPDDAPAHPPPAGPVLPIHRVEPAPADGER